MKNSISQNLIDELKVLSLELANREYESNIQIVIDCNIKNGVAKIKITENL